MKKKIKEEIRLESIINPHRQMVWYRNLEGYRKGNSIWAYTDEELSEYHKCHDNILYFIVKYCKIIKEDGSVGNFNIRDYQKEIIEQFKQHQFNICITSAQMGITIMAVCYLLHEAIFNINFNILHLDWTNSACKSFLTKLKMIYVNLPYFLKPGILRMDKHKISFDNKSEIKSYNCKSGIGIGCSFNIIYVDNISSMKNEKFKRIHDNWYPVIPSKNYGQILYTSRFGGGFSYFYEMFQNSERSYNDPKKNNFNPIRVYWWQIPERCWTRVQLNLDELKKINLTRDIIMEDIKRYNENLIIETIGDDTFKIKIPSRIFYEFSAVNIRKHIINFNNNLYELKLLTKNISDWREEEIKKVGQKAFDIEYDGIF